MAFSDRVTLLSPMEIARLPLFSRLAFDLAYTIAKWQTRSSTRRSLRHLDDHLLQDIGLDARIAFDEGSKRFWQK